MPVHFGRCCGCCSLRTGVITIGAAYTVGSLALMVWRVMQAVDRLQDPVQKTQGEGVQLVYQALMLLVQAAVSVVLIAGAYAKRHLMVKTWFVYSVSASVLMSIVIILKCVLMWSEHDQGRVAFILLLKMLAFMGAAIYCFLVVDSFHSELVRERRVRILGS